ncbi:hypothetical protein [Pelagibius sp. 7325]|uniref:hypothetical protein n=1 Tax=Pelagibius sp. 7325 TaxID=3131994 RepID=UPI0030ECB119
MLKTAGQATAGLRETCAAIVLCSAAALPARAADDWEFAIAPYLLAPSINGEAGMGRFIDGADVDVDSRDIFEHLDLGAMIHAEVRHRSGFGAIVDYSFMDLSGEADGAVVPGAKLKAEVFQGVFEAFASYRFDITPEHKVDAYGGIRWWHIDVELKRRNAPGFNVTEDKGDDWVDPVFGARWVAEWWPGWRSSLAGDIGGFGVSSDFSASAQALIIYDAWENVSVAAGYRALWVDYDNGKGGTPDYFSYDTVTHGPQIGVIFRF